MTATDITVTWVMIAALAGLVALLFSWAFSDSCNCSMCKAKDSARFYHCWLKHKWEEKWTDIPYGNISMLQRRRCLLCGRLKERSV
jgi:hypothetical protein